MISGKAASICFCFVPSITCVYRWTLVLGRKTIVIGFHSNPLPGIFLFPPPFPDAPGQCMGGVELPGHLPVRTVPEFPDYLLRWVDRVLAAGCLFVVFYLLHPEFLFIRWDVFPWISSPAPFTESWNGCPFNSWGYYQIKVYLGGL